MAGSREAHQKQKNAAGTFLFRSHSHGDLLDSADASGNPGFVDA